MRTILFLMTSKSKLVLISEGGYQGNSFFQQFFPQFFQLLTGTI